MAEKTAAHQSRGRCQQAGPGPLPEPRSAAV